jgi:Holliday junction resolvasome RuvABC endonuclease subunit
MLVVGIDPGSYNTGFAWVRLKGAMGQRITKSAYSWHTAGSRMARYALMREKLDTALRQLPEAPLMVAIEEPDRGTNTKPFKVKNISFLNGCYAICVAEVARQFPRTILHDIRYESWTGGLQKSDVYSRLIAKYDVQVPFQNDDVADALGLADYAFEIAKKTSPLNAVKVE